MVKFNTKLSGFRDYTIVRRLSGMLVGQGVGDVIFFLFLTDMDSKDNKKHVHTIVIEKITTQCHKVTFTLGIISEWIRWLYYALLI